MPNVSRTFSVQQTPDRVIDYLKDFSNAEAWDPGTQSCTRSDSGPIREGSTWHNVSKIVGVTAELTYTLNKLSNRTLVFVGTNDSSTSTDTKRETPGSFIVTPINCEASSMVLLL